MRQKSEGFLSISIIIPAHNEEKRISKTLDDYGKFFREYRKNHEIIAVLNGCKDNTLGIVKKYEREYPQLRHLDFKRAGKGFAVSEGFKTAKGELVGFTDADDSTSASEFNKLIENMEGYDGAIASRWMNGSIVEPKQPLFRRIAGRAFNMMNRAMFGLNFKDTQCGSKLFRKEAAKSVAPKLRVTEWAFDANLLYEMKREGFRIKEIPIRWHDVKGSKLNILKIPLMMFLSILRLRLIYSPFSFIIRFYDEAIPEWMKMHHKLK